MGTSGDISPPPGVKAAMEMQAEAERRKRAQVLESEGEPVVSSFFCVCSGAHCFVVFMLVFRLHFLKQVNGRHILIEQMGKRIQ